MHKADETLITFIPTNMIMIIVGIIGKIAQIAYYVNIKVEPIPINPKSNVFLSVVPVFRFVFFGTNS